MAEVHLAARQAASPRCRSGVHSPDEVRALGRRLGPDAHECWVAEDGGDVVGYARFTATWLDDLYVAPAGAGARRRLAPCSTWSRPDRPDGLLAVGVRVQPARARLLRPPRAASSSSAPTASANEERAPDIRVAWPGADPLAFLRGLIDDIDLVLGDVLARRTALTRAVQAVKPSGERDPAREAEIARRVAAVVPELGEERVARIVDVIIAQSLDASR